MPKWHSLISWSNSWTVGNFKKKSKTCSIYRTKSYWANEGTSWWWRYFKNGSAKKVGKRIKELERLYGIRNGSANEKGNNRIGEPNNSVDQKSQSDLAAQMGISVDTLQNYKILSEMIPELEELLDTGVYIFDFSHTIIHGVDNALQIDI